MVKSIFIGSIPFNATEDEIRKLFEPHGPVHSVKLIADRETGRPRGFGFVEMDEESANNAITALNGTQFQGRSLVVNEARERAKKPPMRRRPS